ncbi:SDR family NAD(P)-dependent oxidoreductase [Hyphococcus sp. DH-69]|uniref:SDR family NAD(P)-dependent oxidoreductase n=1 Tax=Hyphococcus formosus TaxID=3143534 RepID=UPI00398B5318
MGVNAASDKGRVAIVTGAGKGLGAAYARALGASGYRLVVNNRKREGEPSSADRIVEDLRNSGVEAVAEYSDVASADASETIVNKAITAFGRLDVVVFNAGIVGEVGWFGTNDIENFRNVLEVNYIANVQLALAALPHLKESGSGRMVFVSSAAGLYGARGLSPYAGAKGALTAFALTLSDELKRYGIGVNVVTPFAVTQMTEGDFGADSEYAKPEHTAPAIVWMASKDNPMTGQIWVAAGGHYRRAVSVETIGGAGENTAEWLIENIDLLSSLEEIKTFPGAQEAFRDIFSEIIRSQKKNNQGEN